jgi:hypothetical protein
MAQTTAELIAELETRLTNVKAKIDSAEQFRALEEGSAQARFRTEFVDIDKLYKERERIRTQLTILGWGGI